MKWIVSRRKLKKGMLRTCSVANQISQSLFKKHFLKNLIESAFYHLGDYYDKTIKKPAMNEK